jgi:transcriptional regulator GlxA family with amidase domain
MLLATLGVGSDFEPTRSERTRQAHSLIVKIAEDHALSRVDDPLYVSDLCRVAGVSERTLEYAFKEVMGLTPMTYLIRLRLHRVRQALLAATQGTTRCRPRRSTGASGTSASSRAPTRRASASCRRTRCDASRVSRLSIVEARS